MGFLAVRFPEVPASTQLFRPTVSDILCAECTRLSASFDRGADCILSRLGADTPSWPTDRRSVCDGLAYAFRSARSE